MKGLLKNVFYASVGNAKVLLALLLVLGAGLCVTGNGALLGGMLLFSAATFAVAAAAPLRRNGRWDRFLLTLPVRRRCIVQSQYAGFLALCLLGTALALAFVGLTVLIHGNLYFYPGMRDFWSMTVFGLFGALLMGALFYPLHYLLGAERNEAALLIALIAAVGIIAAYSLAANALSVPDQMSDRRFYALLILFAVLTSAAFGGSYFLSAALFDHKEC